MTNSRVVSSTGISRHSRTSSRNPPALYLASSQLLKATSVQSQGIWTRAHHKHWCDNESERKRWDKYHRHKLSRFRDKAARRTQTLSGHHHPWWNPGLGWGWGWSGFKSNFPSYRDGWTPQKDFWEAERLRMQQRMEQIKKEIEADPYAALFGRRLQPFSFWDKQDNIFSSLYKSLFGLDKKAGTGSTDTAARPVTTTSTPSNFPNKDKPPSDSATDKNVNSELSKQTDIPEFEFDPISGRMVAKKVKPDENRSGHVESSGRRSETGYDPKPSVPPRKSEEPSAQSTVQETRPLGSTDVNTVKDETPDISEESQKAPPEVSEHNEGIIILGPGQPQDEAASLGRSGDGFENKTSDSWQPSQRDYPDVPGDLHSEMGNQGQKEELIPSGFVAQADSSPINPSSCNSMQEKDPRAKEEMEEDLDLLRASDIRAAYESRKVNQETEMQKEKKRQDLDHQFDSYVDPAGHIDAESIRARFKDHSYLGSVDEMAVKTTETCSDQAHLQSSENPKISDPREQDEYSELIQQPEQLLDQAQPSTGSDLPPQMYRVFAYDPATLQVTEAETSSSLHTTNKFLHPSEVLSRLNNPAKFVPALAKMHNDGYEIISGGGDIIVFKKTYTASPTHPAELTTHYDDGLTGKVESNESEHGQGTVNATSPPYRPMDSTAASDNGVSPEKSSSKGQSRILKTLRKMFIGGVATAATCYAIGVVCEYFRTGGEDGLGIDGFTEFESERRRMARENK